MFLISVVLSVGLTTTFANSFSPNINGGNPRLFPQHEPSMTQGDQAHCPSIPQSSMEGNNQMYPMPQYPMMQPPMMPPPMMPPSMMPPPMMPPPMMQGFQPPLPFNPINQQQLSLLLMSSYARAMALTQLMNMQNRYQLYQPNQYSDSAANNYSPMPAPLPYAQQPQVDPQNNLQNEMLQEQQQQAESQQQQAETQQQQAESQHQDILEKRKIQREFDMEIERREGLMKIKAEENELEKQQQEIERVLRDEEEMKRELEETKKQILKEEQKEMEQKKKDLKLRQKEELRFRKIEAEKMKRNQENMKPKGREIRRLRKQKNGTRN